MKIPDMDLVASVEERKGKWDASLKIIDLDNYDIAEALARIMGVVVRDSLIQYRKAYKKSKENEKKGKRASK